MKYKLFKWYAWGLAENWKLELESDKLSDIKAHLKGRKFLTYVITEGNKVVKYVLAPMRPCMPYPSFPIHYNNEIYIKENSSFPIHYNNEIYIKEN